VQADQEQPGREQKGQVVEAHFLPRTISVCSRNSNATSSTPAATSSPTRTFSTGSVPPENTDPTCPIPSRFSRKAAPDSRPRNPTTTNPPPPTPSPRSRSATGLIERNT